MQKRHSFRNAFLCLFDCIEFSKSSCLSKSSLADLRQRMIYAHLMASDVISDTIMEETQDFVRILLKSLELSEICRIFAPSKRRMT